MPIVSHFGRLTENWAGGEKLKGRRFLLYVGHIRAADSVISAGAIPAHLPIMQLEAIEPRLCARKFASTRNCGDAYLLAVNLPFSTDLHANTAKNPIYRQSGCNIGNAGAAVSSGFSIRLSPLNFH